MAALPVKPERTSAEQKQQRDDREFSADGFLVTAVAVIPGEGQGDGETEC